MVAATTANAIAKLFFISHPPASPVTRKDFGTVRFKGGKKTNRFHLPQKWVKTELHRHRADRRRRLGIALPLYIVMADQGAGDESVLATRKPSSLVHVLKGSD